MVRVITLVLAIASCDSYVLLVLKNSKTILNFSTQKAATEKTQYPRNDKILKKGENGYLQKPKYDKMVKNG